MTAKSGFDRRQAFGIAGAAAGAVTFGVTSSNAALNGAISKDGRLNQVSTPPSELVETTAGKIRGFRRGEVHIFKGIPYGASTSGDARFMPPRQPQPWTGVRTTLSYGPVSPQMPSIGPSQDELQFLQDRDDGFQGEDMLRANLWTTSLSGRGPVMAAWRRLYWWFISPSAVFRRRESGATKRCSGVRQP